ncbi:Hypothetical protein PENO1_078620 [Penicillium occitanis (nom. inval.)]|nr:Hypothetical protein PENO1_078620 [Penicillium occitanis (nom. inval.)]PCG94750.1 hypothetical protein PENOC_081170 [Penicillium occitanis (nom. inval.)]
MSESWMGSEPLGKPLARRELRANSDPSRTDFGKMGQTANVSKTRYLKHPEQVYCVLPIRPSSLPQSTTALSPECVVPRAVNESSTENDDIPVQLRRHDSFRYQRAVRFTKADFDAAGEPSVTAEQEEEQDHEEEAVFSAMENSYPVPHPVTVTSQGEVTVT